MRPSRVIAMAGPWIVAAWVAGCTTGPLGGLVRVPSPHDQYADTLRRAGLDQTALGRDWSLAADEALRRPVSSQLPFHESGYFAPEVPSAVAYQFDLAQGRRLTVEVDFNSLELGRLFVDLFRLGDQDPPRHVSSMAEQARALTYDVNETATYLLRVQPELLRGGRYTLVERTLSSLTFPVTGFTARGVQSGFGAVRDAGVRQHEGIDIFAPAGTPVVAVANGVARPDTNPLGGNVVWLQPTGSRRSYYYAHLDRWAIAGTTLVRAGETLGFVGNTGNASTTMPHLHFGIYEDGAIDPLPFVQPDDAVPTPPATAWVLGAWARVEARRTSLRRGPSGEATPNAVLDRGTLVTVMGATERTLRVVLPDERIGYVAARDLTPAEAPVRRHRLRPGAILRESPAERGPTVLEVAEPLQVDVLGRFGGFAFVRAPDGARGWVTAAAAGVE